MMVKVKCFYANGDTIKTFFIGSPEQAQKYYVGNMFNIGSVNDNMQECIKIECL